MKQGLLGFFGFISSAYAGYGIYDLLNSDISHRSTREVVEYVLSRGIFTGFFAVAGLFCLGQLAATCHKKYASNNTPEIEMEDLPEEENTSQISSQI
jgi:hypothetical protein